MNAELLSKFYKEPQSVNTDGIKELEELCKSFPYFTLPHLVLTKVYKTQNHYRYGDLLKTTALMSPSREWLYDYLEDESEKLLENEITTVEEVNEPLPLQTDFETKIEEQEISEVLFEKDNEIIDEEINSDIEIVAELIEENVLVENSNKDEKEVDSAKNEEVSEISKVAEIKFEFETEISSEKKDDFDLKKTENIPEYHIENFYNWAEGDGSKSFFDWLKNPVYYDNTEEDSNTIAKEISPKNADSMELIEKFLTDRPSISRPKTEFFNPANVAKKAEELHPDLVTETLANLFYKQGSFEKALFAYDILCLKIPEKRHYFASLIQKIKEEQNK